MKMKDQVKSSLSIVQIRDDGDLDSDDISQGEDKQTLEIFWR